MASYLPLIINSGLLAISAAFLAVGVVFLWLYHGQDLIQRNRLLQAAIYLPLLVPQISFLFGLQIGLSWAGIDGSWPALIYIHMIFILPYIWLVLAPAFAQMDWRHDHVASSLGLGPFQAIFTRSLAAFGHADWRGAIHRFCCLYRALSANCFCWWWTHCHDHGRSC
jgi:putative thiamine transport system permease protein